ncbi:Uncharacterized metal-binding protein YceD, DUF177 family [Nonlabens sp. Hel1_33_55]|uniref:YceD family protein n=1 Tax=Nonlabens sp. Hel1_33_55 TaxID=1336802 RepID=UPI000875E9C8|nr:DUF177 domain-containing protein [Nonlabens sp. Hel1_33_55]SCY34154.1 Uncharacterized metal-binding protein YceD, DUF177 family [Nonlabens sp. Hel1_33_55]
MELKEFKIAFAGLKQGKHEFSFELDNEFFESFGYDEFNSAAVIANVELDKRSTLMDLHLLGSGSVNVNCDVTNEPFDMPVEAMMDIVVKFGDRFNDENEDILILPHGEYELNVAQYLYEMVALSIPLKKTHPGLEDGSLESDVLDKLEELKLSSSDEIEDGIDTDPRWDALKKLKTDNN